MLKLVKSRRYTTIARAESNDGERERKIESLGLENGIWSLKNRALA